MGFYEHFFELAFFTNSQISMLRFLSSATCNLHIRPTIQINFLSLVQTDVHLLPNIFYGFAMNIW